MSQQQLNLLSTTNTPPSFSLSSPSTSTSTSTSTSVVIVIIVIASAIIVSASLYLLLRFLSRRFHSTPTPPPPILRPNFTNSKHHSISSSLPLFTLNSLPAKISGGDCAVCLSKFEPDDQLRLLPLCCHAFHADCIDTWLVSNLTCPLCRSTVHPSLSDALDKILPSRTNSFRVEIGSVSRRRSDDDFSGDAVRSYTIGSFEYVVDEEVEVPIRDERAHRRDVSDKDSISTAIEVSIPVAPGDELAAEVAVERGSWLRDYVDRIATVSSRSFRSSGRFFGGSSRRSNAVVGVDDLEANSRFGEEISELFQWLSRV